MYKKKTEAIYAEEIAEFLDLKLKGHNCPVYGPSRSKDPEENTMIFYTEVKDNDSTRLENYSELLVIVPMGVGEDFPGTVIESPNPQRIFVRILN